VFHMYRIQQPNFSAQFFPAQPPDRPPASNRRLHHSQAGGEYMSHYGTLKEQNISEAAQDIRGAKLYGLNDEKLGKIDDVIFDHSTGLIRYVVVDTGGWLKTKKFIVPADSLRASANHKDDFEVDLNTRQFATFLSYN